MKYLKNKYVLIGIAVVVIIIIIIIVNANSKPKNTVASASKPIVQPSGVSSSGATPTNPNQTINNIYVTSAPNTSGYIEESTGGWTDGQGYFVGPNYEPLVNSSMPWDANNNPAAY